MEYCRTHNKSWNIVENSMRSCHGATLTAIVAIDLGCCGCCGCCHCCGAVVAVVAVVLWLLWFAVVAVVCAVVFVVVAVVGACCGSRIQRRLGRFSQRHPYPSIKVQSSLCHCCHCHCVIVVVRECRWCFRGSVAQLLVSS